MQRTMTITGGLADRFGRRPVLLGAAAMAAAPAAVGGRIAGGLTSAIFLGQLLSPLASQPWIATFGSDAPWRDAAILLALMASVAALLRIGAVRSASHGRDKTP